MSYDLDLYFRSPDFPDKEWAEILSWFDAIERTVEPENFGHTPYLGKEWFIQVGGYGLFCTVYERHPRYQFKDEKALWEVFIFKLIAASAYVSFSAIRSATMP